jgi:dienelactone hydrolase
MKPNWTVAACILASASSLLSSQTIEVTPKRAMVDEPVTISATGLQPNERVAIRAELVDGEDARWISEADFIADAQGSIDVSKQAPVAGSYQEVSAMGLIWSMRPASVKAIRYQPPRRLAPQIIEFQLLRQGQRLSTAGFEQDILGDGVGRIEVRDLGLRGVLYRPAGTERHPGVLVLGGSEGGLPNRRAAWLASHGFSAFALAYFRYEDLPQDLAAIPLEYFGRALSYMAQRKDILGDHVAVMGISRGAELSLQLGSMYPRIGAVVAYAPANVRYPACCGFTPVPYAWTWNGKPLPFLPYRHEASHPDLAMGAVIEVEHISGPVLLISGEADHVWESWSMADSVAARLKRSHFAYPVVNLKYPHAGHAAGRPEIVPAWQEKGRNPVTGRELDLGGSPRGNADSSLDAIGKVIEFLQQRFLQQSRPGP